MSVLAFRTKVGAVPIPAGSSLLLGTVDVTKFSKIRVVADERVGAIRLGDTDLHERRGE